MGCPWQVSPTYGDQAHRLPRGFCIPGHDPASQNHTGLPLSLWTWCPIKMSGLNDTQMLASSWAKALSFWPASPIFFPSDIFLRCLVGVGPELREPSFNLPSCLWVLGSQLDPMLPCHPGKRQKEDIMRGGPGGRPEGRVPKITGAGLKLQFTP